MDILVVIFTLSPSVEYLDPIRRYIAIFSWLNMPEKKRYTCTCTVTGGVPAFVLSSVQEIFCWSIEDGPMIIAISGR